jgi:hypothetical protein
MGISIRAYARHRGVSDTAVHKAIREGRITREADGSIDAARADREWARNSGDPVLRETAKPVANPAAKPTVKPGTQTPPSREASAEPVVPPLTVGGTTLLQARTVHEALRVQLRKVELAEKKEELVDRARAVAHVFKLAREERDAWLNWPNRIAPQLAVHLEVDEHTLHVALDAAVREQMDELGAIHPKVTG